LLAAIGMPPVEGDVLPGYVAWLPDRTVTLHRDPRLWAEERLRLGDTPRHRKLWALFDRIAAVFWGASRRGVRLPVRNLSDALHAARTLGVRHLPLVRYLHWTIGDALRALKLRQDRPLAGLLAMLIEDTVHSSLDRAPLINGVLGATIRGAGLTRARGGMCGFWRRFVAHYRRLGGQLRVGTQVTRVHGREGDFAVETRRGSFRARRVVSALPAQLTARIAPPGVAEALAPYLRRDSGDLGGAMVVFLGVPEAEVAGQSFTHHQLLQDFWTGGPSAQRNGYMDTAAPELSPPPALSASICLPSVQQQ
jgi:phytoene dehydrogenase-like protein